MVGAKNGGGVKRPLHKRPDRSNPTPASFAYRKLERQAADPFGADAWSFFSFFEKTHEEMDMR